MNISHVFAIIFAICFLIVVMVIPICFCCFRDDDLIRNTIRGMNIRFYFTRTDVWRRIYGLHNFA